MTGTGRKLVRGTVPLALAGAAFGLVPACGSSTKPPASPPAPKAKAHPSPTPRPSASPTLSMSAPAGRYRLESRVVDTDFTNLRIGQASTATWTISLTCTPASCHGTVVSSGGLHYTATFDGTTLTANNTGTQTQACPVIPGKPKGSAVIRYVISARLTVAQGATPAGSGQGPPTRMTGTFRDVNSAVSVAGYCFKGPSRKTDETLTLTRLP